MSGTTMKQIVQKFIETKYISRRKGSCPEREATRSWHQGVMGSNKNPRILIWAGTQGIKRKMKSKGTSSGALKVK